MPFNGYQMFSEIRQGFFLTVLLTFWLCFAGEHVVVSECLSLLRLGHVSRVCT